MALKLILHLHGKVLTFQIDEVHRKCCVSNSSGGQDQQWMKEDSIESVKYDFHVGLFPPDLKKSTSPHFEILGAPIGDIIFCSKFVAQKRAEAFHLLKQLEETGSTDPKELSLKSEAVWVMKKDKPDWLIPNWELGQPVAVDLSITSPLCHENIQPKSITTNPMYGRLNLNLVRAVSRAILSRSCMEEKIIHGLRKCIEDHWDDEDFVVLKVDMRNAFNLVSRQAILDECASLFPELLPWVLWCYGTHSALWHPMGRVSSESGVQQGDPLGPLLFALVLQNIISAVDVDVECIEMLFNAWFLDDGVLAGPKSAVLRAMHLIEELGPPFGIFINLAKCELYSRNELSSTFPVMIKSSQVPHLEILGAPIGDFLFCSKFIASRRKIASKLLSKLEEVASIDPQVALILVRLCGGFCKMVHVARTTPPHLAFSSLESFDSDVRMCFSNCVATDISDVAWKQAQLGLSYGGLGLRSISHHSCAAYIASLSFSGLGSADNPHLMRSIVKYNGLVSPPDGISVESILASPIPQRILSQRLDDHSFGLVIAAATDADKARLLSTSAPHAASWLSVVPSIGLGLHLDPNELQIAVKWWLGLDTSRGSSCGLCPDVALDPLGHHAATCRRGGDVVIRHNRLRDVVLSFCHQAHIAARLEAGSGLTPGLDRARPADVLVRDWAQGKPAAFDITVTSPLTPAILAEASRRVGAAAEAAENRKHTANDPKCAELGWRCMPLAVETYCNWGEEARGTFALLATRLAFGSSSFRKARVISDMFGRLNITLVRAIARAILARTVIPSDFS
eukprot:Em0005g483a